MNDFESRARAAGRAARDAVDDVPAVQMHVSTRSRPRPSRNLLVAAAVVLVLAISGVLLAQRQDGPSATQVSAFCDFLLASQHSGQTIDERRARELAPADLVTDIGIIAKAGSDVTGASREQLKRFEESGQRVAAWMQTNCYPKAALPDAAPADQRFAPDPLPAETQLCYVLNGPLPQHEPPSATPSHITIYANTSLSDPWQGPLLATAVDETSLIASYDEGSAGVPTRPEALAGAIAGPNNTPVGDSRAIEWDNNTRGATVAILARGEPLKSQLGGLAEHVVDATGPPTIDPAALPDHYSVVYSGAVEPLTEVSGPTANFLVNARTGTSTRQPFSGVTWSGSDMTDDAIQATRFFANSPRLQTSGNTTALVWDSARGSTPGSTFARWREPGGVVLTAEWSSKKEVERRNGIDQLIGAMHRLNRDEWTAITRQFSYCGALSTLGRSRSSSGSSSVTSTATSVTSVVPPTSPAR